jgi:hypothetical protein
MIMNRIFKVLSVAIVAASTAPAQADVIYALNETTPSVNVNSSPGANWSRGWQFNVNISDVWVVELGLNTPSPGTGFTLSLWDLSDNSIIAQTDASDTGTGWDWYDITPVALSNGGSYIVSLHSVNNAPYYFGNNQSSLKPSGDIDYVTMKYCNGCTANTFPTSTLNGYNYGIPDFGYVIGEPTGDSVPAPGALLLLGLGLVGLGLRRRA